MVACPSRARRRSTPRDARCEGDLAEVLEAARFVLKEPGVRLKLATVVSGVNRDDLPSLAPSSVTGAGHLALYQYSRRGEQNVGQRGTGCPGGLRAPGE